MIPSSTQPSGPPGPECRAWSCAARALALGVATLSATVLLAWVFDIDALKRIRPGWVSMNPVTAVCFLLVGFSLYSNASPAWPRWSHRAGLAGAALAAFIALVCLTRDALEIDFAIDRILFTARLDIGQTVRNHMAPNTAACFLLTGVASVLAWARSPRWHTLAAVLLAAAGLIALLALVGYANGVSSLSTVGPRISIAVHTAVGFIALSAGILCGLQARVTARASTADGGAGPRSATIGLAAALAIMGIIGIVSYASLKQFLAESQRADRTRQVLVGMQELGSALKDAETGSRGYVITGQDEYLEPYTSAQGAVRNETRELRDLIADDSEQQRRLDTLERLIGWKQVIQERVIALRREQGFEAAQQVISSGEGRRTMDEIRAMLSAMTDAENAVLAKGNRAKDSGMRTTIAVIIAGSVLGVVLVGLTAWIIRRELAGRLALERRLHQVQDEMGRMARVGGWELETATGRLTWSEQMYAIYEVPRTYVPQLATALDNYPGEYKGIVAGHVQRAMETGNTFEFTVPFITAKGRHLWVRAIGNADRRPNGTVRLYGAFQDVTQSHLASEKLVKALDAAQAANRAKTEFLANMSHEIRTPLTAILGYADILREEGDLEKAPASRMRHLDTIRLAGQHLMSVINNILDISKIEAGGMAVQRIATPLTAILAEVESYLRPLATGKGIALSVRLDSPVPESILSEPTHLRQILMNLTGNAVKFTESGSVSLSVRARDTEKRRLLEIDVEDSGPGMTPQQAEAVFDPFTQADGGMTRRHGGTGLGLTISRRLAVLMGGNVILEHTAPGKGSLFRLQLPLEAVPGAPMTTTITNHAVRSATPTHATEAACLKGRILLAEDGPENQRLIAFHLRKAGAEVELADNGKIALAKLLAAEAQGTLPDLLLTDMQMPEMDGYALARTLRDQGSRLAIVALTAHALAEDRDRCLGAGCDDYATKPIDKQRLLALCAAWMGKTGGGVTISAA